MPSKLIKITSNHDSSHINHSEFKYNLDHHSPELQSIKSIVLVTAVISNTHYNINTYNNVLRYNLNAAGVASLTIPVGQYNATTLLAYLQTNIAGTTWTLDSTTYKINIATTQSLDLYSSADDALSTIAPNLGINTTLNILAASNDDAENTMDINGTDMVLVESNRLGRNNMLSSFSGTIASDKPVVACIPITTLFGDNEIYEHLSSEETRITYDTPRAITNIDIKLTDKDHNILTLQTPCTLVFRFYY